MASKKDAAVRAWLWASRDGDSQRVLRLMKGGCDVTIPVRVEERRTLLHLAAQRNDVRMLATVMKAVCEREAARTSAASRTRSANTCASPALHSPGPEQSKGRIGSQASLDCYDSDLDNRIDSDSYSDDDSGSSTCSSVDSIADLLERIEMMEEEERLAWGRNYTTDQPGPNVCLTALLDCRDAEGWTPLHVAVHSGSAAVVKLLLEAGADEQALCNRKHTPVYYARHAAVFALLVRTTPRISCSLRAAFEELLRQHVQEAEEGTEVDEDGAGCMVGIECSNHGLPAWHLNGACMDAQASSAFRPKWSGATRDGGPHKFHSLPDASPGTDPCESSAAPGQKAHWAGFDDMVTIRSEVAAAGPASAVSIAGLAHAQIVVPGGPCLTALHLLCSVIEPGEDDRMDAAKLYALIDSGADISAVDSGGRTGLHRAAIAGRQDLVQALLMSERDGNAGSRGTVHGLGHGLGLAHVANEDGMTALHYAALYGQSHIIEDLLLGGCNTECTSKDGATPLLLACATGSHASVKCLLIAGACVTKADAEGRTPAHVAASAGHTPCLALLIAWARNQSAAVTLSDLLLCRDQRGRLPLHDACGNGHESAALLMLSHMSAAMYVLNGPQIPPSATKNSLPSCCDAAGTFCGILPSMLKDEVPNEVWQAVALALAHAKVTADAGGGSVPPSTSTLSMSLPSSNTLNLTASPSSSVPGEGCLHSRTAIRSASLQAVKSASQGLASKALRLSGMFSVPPLLLRAATAKTPAVAGHSDANSCFGLSLWAEEGSRLAVASATGSGWGGLAHDLPWHLPDASGTNVQVHGALPPGSFPVCLPSFQCAATALSFQSTVRGSGCVPAPSLAFLEQIGSIGDEAGWTVAHEAAGGGCPAVLRFLIGLGVDIGRPRASDGHGVVHDAAVYGRAACLSMLRERGFDLGRPDPNGDTPLHWAAFKGNEHCVRVLLQAAAARRVPASMGRRAVASLGPMTAGSSGMFGSLEAAAGVGWGVSLSARNTDGGTPLHSAANSGSVAIGRLLLEAGADPLTPMADGNIALHNSAFEGHADFSRLLISYGGPMDVSNEEGRFPLHEAAANGHALVIQALLAGTESVQYNDKYGDTHTLTDAVVGPADLSSESPMGAVAPMQGALRSPRGMVSRLLSSAASAIGREGGDASRVGIGAAAMLRNVEISPSAGAANTQPVSSPLPVAPRAMVRSNPNVQDVGGDTPLHWAVFNNSPMCTRALLDNGALPTMNNVDGGDPIHASIINNSVGGLRALLEAGADPNTKFRPIDSGWSTHDSALHVAAAEGRSDCVRLLLVAGADADIRNSRKRTPLHDAVRAKMRACVEVLLAAGADISLLDDTDRTPFGCLIPRVRMPALVVGGPDDGSGPPGAVKQLGVGAGNALRPAGVMAPSGSIGFEATVPMFVAPVRSETVKAAWTHFGPAFPTAARGGRAFSQRSHAASAPATPLSVMQVASNGSSSLSLGCTPAEEAADRLCLRNTVERSMHRGKNGQGAEATREWQGTEPPGLDMLLQVALAVDSSTSTAAKGELQPLLTTTMVFCVSPLLLPLNVAVLNVFSSARCRAYSHLPGRAAHRVFEAVAALAPAVMAIPQGSSTSEEPPAPLERVVPACALQFPAHTVASGMGAMADLWADGKFADVWLRPSDGGPDVPAHRVVLASRAEPLHVLLAQDWAESGSSVVNVSMRLNVLLPLLAWVYTGKLQRSTLPIALALLEIGDAWDQSELVNAALASAADALNLDDLVLAFEWATERYAAGRVWAWELLLACADFFVRPDTAVLIRTGARIAEREAEAVHANAVAAWRTNALSVERNGQNELCSPLCPAKSTAVQGWGSVQIPTSCIPLSPVVDRTDVHEIDDANNTGEETLMQAPHIHVTPVKSHHPPLSVPVVTNMDGFALPTYRGARTAFHNRSFSAFAADHDGSSPNGDTGRGMSHAGTPGLGSISRGSGSSMRSHVSGASASDFIGQVSGMTIGLSVANANAQTFRDPIVQSSSTFSRNWLSTLECDSPLTAISPVPADISGLSLGSTQTEEWTGVQSPALLSKASCGRTQSHARCRSTGRCGGTAGHMSQSQQGIARPALASRAAESLALHLATRPSHLATDTAAPLPPPSPFSSDSPRSCAALPDNVLMRLAQHGRTRLRLRLGLKSSPASDAGPTTQGQGRGVSGRLLELDEGTDEAPWRPASAAHSRQLCTVQALQSVRETSARSSLVGHGSHSSGTSRLSHATAARTLSRISSRLDARSLTAQLDVADAFEASAQRQAATPASQFASPPARSAGTFISSHCDGLRRVRPPPPAPMLDHYLSRFSGLVAFILDTDFAEERARQKAGVSAGPVAPMGMHPVECEPVRLSQAQVAVPGRGLRVDHFEGDDVHAPGPIMIAQ